MKTPTQPTNVSLNSALLVDAKKLGLNVSKACEAGLAQSVSEAKGKRWQEENREAIEYWNQYVEENGLILERYRLF
jgi:antitoxin CcdA